MGALANLFRVEEIRKKIFLTLSLMFVYRIGFHIPLPGVNWNLYNEYAGNAAKGGVAQFIGLMNALSAGNINTPTLMSLGILPYISSSIIFSLLGKTIPALEALSKEGAAGQRKINQYSRLLTIPLCLVQGTVIYLTMFKPMAVTSSGTPSLVMLPGVGIAILAVLGMTCGTLFLMWVGEQITEYGIGNGISLLITAGILSNIPAAFARIWTEARENRGYILTAIILLGIYICIVLAVVYMTKGARRIPIQQAKLMKGRRMVGGARHFLPLKLNMANVMPVIFASSLLILPSTVLRAFSDGQSQILSYGGWWWITIEIALIFFFSYFWTSLMFQPSEMANNLKEYGSFIPGIQPGRRTAKFLEKVMVRITLVGAAFLAAIAIVPTIISQSLEVDFIVAQFLGGTGILIVVGVTLDLVDKLNASLLRRNYEGFMGKSGSRG